MTSNPLVHNGAIKEKKEEILSRQGSSRGDRSKTIGLNSILARYRDGKRQTSWKKTRGNREVSRAPPSTLAIDDWRVGASNIQVYSSIKVSWPRWHIPRPHVVNFRVSAGRHTLFLSTDLNTIVKLPPPSNGFTTVFQANGASVRTSRFFQLSSRFRDKDRTVEQVTERDRPVETPGQRNQRAVSALTGSLTRGILSRKLNYCAIGHSRIV